MAIAHIEQNWNATAPGFKDPDHGDVVLDPKSPAFVVCGFDSLSLDKIGLYNDELRASWPVSHPCGNYEPLRLEGDITLKPAVQLPLAAVGPGRPLCRAAGRIEPWRDA